MAAVRGAGPPDHRLVARAGQRHVGQAQVLAALLGDVPAVVVGAPRRSRAAHVDGALLGLGVVEDRGVVVLDPERVPQVRAVDDRELQPLAAVDGQHLDRLGVGLQAPAGLLLVGVAAGVGDPPPQPGGQRGHPELAGGRGGVQQLAHVAQVGELALAVGARQQARGHALGPRRRLEQRRHAAPAQQRGPAVQARLQVLHGPLVGLGDPRGAPAEEAGERRRGRPPRRGGPLERLQQAQPLPGGVGREDAAGAVDHRRDAGPRERVADLGRVAVHPHQHGHARRPDRIVAPDARPRGQQPHDVGGQVLGDQPAGVRGRGVAGRGELDPVGPVEHPDAQGGVDRRAAQARLAVRLGRPDRPVDDVGVPQARATEQRLVGVQQPLVAAPVDLERGLRAGRPRRLQVGVDVGAAEGVDGLLGVADQDQRPGLAGERAPHDLPLDRVGVLELVHQHHAEALAQPLAGPAAARRVGERVAQPADQVVVGHQGAGPLAPLDLVAHGDREPPAHRDPLVVGLGRLDAGAGVVDHDPRDVPGVVVGELRAAVAVEAAHVEVVDHLLHQVADVLDDDRIARDVAAHAEAPEHPLAEAVGGGDGGGVEVGERLGQARPPPQDRFAAALAQQAQHRVLGRRRDAGQRPAEPLLGAHQPLAHAVAQLARGHAGEGDHQQLLQRRTLGDEPRGEGRDGERLAGAGAGLQHGHARWQRPARIEGRDALVHASSTASAASRGSHSRWA